MWERGSVFIVRSEDVAGWRLATALRQFDWDTRVFASVDALLEHVSGDAPDLLVVQGPCAGMADLVHRVRQAAPGARVVWQDGGATTAQRAAALDAGVDACVPPDMELLEWDALLRSLCRRARCGPGAWRVVAFGRMLVGPRGERLPITLRERAVLIRLFNAPGHCLHRESFFPAQARDPLDSARRVDVVVSRLRNKARRFNIDLPLLAVRGWGYILLPEGAGRAPAVVAGA